MKRVVLICPGRGTYTKTELGYLRRPASADVMRRIDEMVAYADGVRSQNGDVSLRELDDAPQFGARHMIGENAGALIFTCTAADAARLDRSKVDVVAVIGNSMGWYTALHVGGVFDFEAGFRIADTMGGMQRGGPIGGQVIHPIVDGDWRHDAARLTDVESTLAAANAAGHRAGWSIRLGGLAVLWGDAEGVRFLLARLPKVKLGEREYPFQLQGHAAFHSPLLESVATRAQAELSSLPWGAPAVPLIDGRGVIWRPRIASGGAIFDYTLGTQIVETFDYSAAVRVALREFAPDHLVLLGPGDTLGGATAQVLIRESWRGMRSKADFAALQAEDPFLIAMSRPDQAARL